MPALLNNKSSKYIIGVLATGDFAYNSLQALISNNYKISALITKPIKKSGRGLKKQQHLILDWAKVNNVPSYTPEHLTLDILKSIFPRKPDILLVIAYGQILSSEIIDWHTVSCLNLHGSLLPKFRGADPIRNFLLSQEKTTGVTLQKVAKKMDSGDIFGQTEVDISAFENYDSLHDKLSVCGAKLLLSYLPKIETIVPTVQNNSLVTFASKLDKDTRILSANLSARLVLGRISAWSPKPGAYLVVTGPKAFRLSVLRAEIIKDSTLKRVSCGTKFIYNGYPAWQCNDFAIKLLSLRPESKKAIDGVAFLNGYGWELFSLSIQ